MYQAQSIPQVSPSEFAARRAQKGTELQLIDVREPDEIVIASMEGFDVLPLSEFAEWSETILPRFNRQAETYVICHHGMRSAQMCQWLLNNGFTNVTNISGGIDAYSIVIDPSIPRY